MLDPINQSSRKLVRIRIKYIKCIQSENNPTFEDLQLIEIFTYDNIDIFLISYHNQIIN